MSTADGPAPEGTPSKPGPRSHNPEHLGRFLVVTLQVGLALLVLWQFRILEDRGLQPLLPLIFGGFLVHAWTPERLRLPLFLVLSLVSFALVLGTANAAILVGLGLGLIGLAHLPIPHLARCVLLVLAGCGLAALRKGWVPDQWQASGWIPVVLPILGAIFMFRMMIYLYDLRHEPPGVTLAQRLAYFFLLPNCLLPLFPIVDYKTFLRTRYNAPPTRIYQQGADWIVRGAMHVVLYRLLYQNYQPVAADVDDLLSLVLFVTTAWLIYLRVSGLFHIAVGMLCLFGFHLPATNNKYFLAAGFNDLWRRGNIYWKDFMMKIFYYPVFMRLRKRGPIQALVVSTLVVFVASWLLHSYQWFWVRGDFPVTWMDVCFFGIFGVAVLANSLMQVKSGPSRPQPKGAPMRLGPAWVHSGKVLAMFTTMCALWSYWCSASFAEWCSVMAAGLTSAPIHYLWLALGVAGLLTAGVVAQALLHKGIALQPSSLGSRALATTGTALVLLALGTPQIHPGDPPALLASLRSEGLNQGDQEAQARGYYEGTLATNRNLLGGAWEAGMQKPDDWIELRNTEAVRDTGDLLVRELVPDHSFTFKDAPLRTNRWGMRDQEYTQEKPEGTRRIALLGGSVELGAGVDGHQVYEALVERRMNEAAAEGAYEILNFGVSGYSLLQMVVVAEQKALGFEPDVCLVAAHSLDLSILRSSVQLVVESGIRVPYPRLREILADSGLRPGLPSARAARLLNNVMDELVEWSYGKIVALCRARGIRPAWVYLPLPRDGFEGPGQGTEARLKRIAKKTGFVILSLDHARVYGDKDPDSLSLRPWDMHPNIEGHELLAAGLWSQLLEHQEALQLGLFGEDAPR